MDFLPEAGHCQSELLRTARPQGDVSHHATVLLQSINTFSGVGVGLADRSLKNKKSLTAAELSGCHDGTVIDIDVLSCCGSSAHRYSRDVPAALLYWMCTNRSARAHTHVPVGN